MDQGFHIFQTTLGWAGLAWGGQGLIGSSLPESDRERVLARTRRRFPDAVESDDPPAEIRRAVEEISALLSGARPTLAEVRIDEARVPEFARRVYALARAIPPGSTRTYGELATELGDRLLAREVGQALGANPWPIVVPCHRITAAKGRLGGFSAPGGQQTKLRLLAIEGAPAAAQGDLFG